MKKLIYLLPIFILLASCSTSKRVSVLYQNTPTTEITVYGEGQIPPANAKLIGNVNIEDGGFTTKCSYSQVVSDATEQAKAMGGNALYIKKHKTPDFWSTCHRIYCDVYIIQ